MPDTPPYRTAFDNGVDRLYHYQKFNPEHLENTLVRGLVRFARPSSFNDPWDCKPVFSIPQDKNEREAMVRYMAAASAKRGTTLDPDERVCRVQELITNPQELRRLMDKLAPEMHKQMDERYRVYCLTRRPASPLMWAHYADHHRGICLEINVRQPIFVPQFKSNTGKRTRVSASVLIETCRHSTRNRLTGSMKMNTG